MDQGLHLRPQSRPEEIANSVIHGVALVASLAAIPALMLLQSGPRDAWQITGGAIFGATLVLMYAASTLYHAVPVPRMKHVLRIIDHGAIFLLIAGSYTPFTLGALRGPIGWTMFAAVWTLALFGITAKCVWRFKYRRLSTVLYLGMGWMAVLALRPMLTHVSTEGMLWLLAGGLCYTFGVVFYVTDWRIRYGHAVWHGFVAAGSACHFWAVLWHSAPRVA